MRWTKEGKSELGVAGKRVASAGVKRGGGGFVSPFSDFHHVNVEKERGRE